MTIQQRQKRQLTSLEKLSYTNNCQDCLSNKGKLFNKVKCDHPNVNKIVVLVKCEHSKNPNPDKMVMLDFVKCPFLA